MKAAAATLTCTAGPTAVCHAAIGQHFTFSFTEGDPLNGIPSIDRYGPNETEGSDGIPDYLNDLDASLEDSYSAAVTLGFLPIGRTFQVVITAQPSSAETSAGTLSSAATDVLTLPNTDESRWIGARTAFFDMLANDQLQGGLSRAGNLAGDGWWIDATSAWFAMQSLQLSTWIPAQHRYDYASSLAEFLARPTEDLTTWDGPSASPSRSKGEFLLPEYLAERFGPAVILDIYQRMNAALVDPQTSSGVAGVRLTGDPLTAIQTSLAVRGTSLEAVLPQFAEANWELACPSTTKLNGYCTSETGGWASALQTDPRTAGPHGDAPMPTHQSAGQAVANGPSTSDGVVSLSAGGSAYIHVQLPNVDLACGQNGVYSCYQGRLQAFVSGDGATPFAVRIDRFQTFNGSAAKQPCDDPVTRVASTSSAFLMQGQQGLASDESCTGALLIITRTDVQPGGSLGTNHPEAVDFTWNVTPIYEYVLQNF